MLIFSPVCQCSAPGFSTQAPKRTYVRTTVCSQDVSPFVGNYPTKIIKDSMSAVHLSTAVEIQRSFIVELLDSVCGWVVFLLIQVPLESLFI